VLERNGMRLPVEILENYGIDSETDLSVIDQDMHPRVPLNRFTYDDVSPDSQSPPHTHPRVPLNRLTHVGEL
jgi:hypothetical protein